MGKQVAVKVVVNYPEDMAELEKRAYRAVAQLLIDTLPSATVDSLIEAYKKRGDK